MKFINRIKIKYFRSIYSIDFKDISQSLTVFTGRNDVGKSNILRALNLFFNGEVDPNDPLDFERDFSKNRDLQIKQSSKERKLISIEIEFNNPGGYTTLPDTFSHRKSWDRDGKLIEEAWNNKVKKEGLRSANKFLNSIEYTYIPAIKDKDTFGMLLDRLKSNLPKPKSIEFEKFNKEIEGYGEELKKDLNKCVKLEPTLSLPTSINELFSSLDFIINDGTLSTSLSQRGDGIRCRFIPAILNYIAQNSYKRHIWGLEEPENSLEFGKAVELNNTIEKTYSKKIQVFATSHSPAFVGDIAEDSHKIIYLLNRDNEGLISSQKIDRRLLLKDDLHTIGDELGYIEMQKELAIKLKASIEKFSQKEAELKKLQEDLESTTHKYILCVEGKYDKKIIETAWRKINSNNPQSFYVHVCYSSSQIRTLLMQENLNDLHPDKVFMGLFDFDSAFSDWNGFKGDKKEEDIITGLLKKGKNQDKYALLLPVPTYRTDYASVAFGNTSLLDIELLFNDDIMRRNSVQIKSLTGGGTVWNITGNAKKKISENLSSLNSSDFEEFKKVFALIEKIQNNEYCEATTND